MSNKSVVAAVAATAAVLAVAACDPSHTSSLRAHASLAPASFLPAPRALARGADGLKSATDGFTSGTVGTMAAPGVYDLRAMPAGQVTVSLTATGQLQARLDMFGLTPGSSHNADIDDSASNAFVHVATFPVFTADATGQAHVLLTAFGSFGSLPPGSRFVLRLGTYGSDFNRSALAEEMIARSDLIPAKPHGARPLPVRGQTVDANGVRLGRPAGRATIVFDAKAQTLTVTLTASGLTPGPHAAHIHSGTCTEQGPVKYMMADFTADAAGNIVQQTRVITGVASVPASGWYLNVHQGGMNDILANGAPALPFRPMLCADLSTFGTPNADPSPIASDDMANNAVEGNQSMPSVMPSPSASLELGMMPTAVAAPSSAPTLSPTPHF